MIKLFPSTRPRRTVSAAAPARREPRDQQSHHGSAGPQPCELGACIRADRAPVDSLVELPDCCLQRVLAHQPALATRLLELGFRPGARVRMGRTVAGGARVVTIGSARYAVDARTLRQLDVVAVAA